MHSFAQSWVIGKFQKKIAWTTGRICQLVHELEMTCMVRSMAVGKRLNKGYPIKSADTIGMCLPTWNNWCGLPPPPPPPPAPQLTIISVYKIFLKLLSQTFPTLLSLIKPYFCTLPSFSQEFSAWFYILQFPNNIVILLIRPRLSFLLDYGFCPPISIRSGGRKRNKKEKKELPIKHRPIRPCFQFPRARSHCVAMRDNYVWTFSVHRCTSLWGKNNPTSFPHVVSRHFIFLGILLGKYAKYFLNYGRMREKQHIGCLPFTWKNHLVRDCANGTQKLQLENLVRSMRFPFTVRPEAPEAVKTNYKFVWN